MRPVSLVLVPSSVALAVALAGCGGGGGGSSSTPTPTSTSQVAITNANYTTAAQESVSSGFYLASSSSIATGAQTGDNAVLVNFARKQFPKLSDWVAAAPVASGVQTSGTSACSGGGTLTVSVTDRNSNSILDALDSLTITANNCIEDGDRINGGLSVSIGSLSGSLSSDVYNVSLTLTFNNLIATTGTTAITGNGSLTLAETSRAANDITSTITASSFAVSANYAGTVYSRSLSSFQLGMRSTPATAPATGYSVSTSITGTVASSALESRSVTLSTETPFVTLNGGVHPSSGRLVATGASGSKVRVTAQNSTTVLVELDANGDGTYETSVTKLWSDLT